MCAAPGSKTAQLIEMLHACDSPVPGTVIVTTYSIKCLNLCPHLSVFVIDDISNNVRFTAVT